MAKIYFYPRIKYKVKATPNPYIADFISSLSIRNNVANTYNNKIGILDLFMYLFKVDIYIFNWIENLSLRRFGYLQVVVFYIYLFIAKRLNKKIVWILHNKYTHNENKSIWIDIMFKTMMKNSDLIITHSNDGLNFIKEQYPQCSANICYIIHPVKRVSKHSQSLDVKYDFLIWGVILPYKGIIEFLQYVSNSNGMGSFKILIAGKCPDKEYKSQLNRYLSDNIIHFDKYFDLEEILSFANQSRCILFTYKPESVLSSGSLMDSIGMDSIIVGPNIGAFKDLSSFRFVKTYDSFDDLIGIYNNLEQNKDIIRFDIEKFCNENSWEQFGVKLDMELKKLF